MLNFVDEWTKEGTVTSYPWDANTRRYDPIIEVTFSDGKCYLSQDDVDQIVYNGPHPRPLAKIGDKLVVTCLTYEGGGHDYHSYKVSMGGLLNFTPIEK